MPSTGSKNWQKRRRLGRVERRRRRDLDGRIGERRTIPSRTVAGSTFGSIRQLTPASRRLRQRVGRMAAGEHRRDARRSQHRVVTGITRDRRRRGGVGRIGHERAHRAPASGVSIAAVFVKKRA